MKPLLVVLFCMWAMPALATDRAGPIHMDAYINLPSPGSLVLAKSGNHLVIFSGNGRYMVTGKIYDMWNHGKQITSLKQGKISARRIVFNKMRLNLNDMGAITLGSKKDPRVVVFIDLGDRHSQFLMKQLAQVDRHYQVAVMIVAAINSQSAPLARRLMCLNKNDQEAARSFVTTDNVALLPPDGPCGRKMLVKAVITASILGIRQMPTVIAPNGEKLVGNVSTGNLLNFLKENR